MRSFNDLYAILDLLGAVPGLLLALFLFRKGAHNRLLAGGLIAYCGLIGGMGLSRLGLMELSRQGNLLLTSLVHVAWPFFYEHVRTLSRGTSSLSKRDLLHGLPLVTYLLLAVLPSLLMPGWFSAVYLAAMSFTVVVALAYSVGMLVELARYRSRVQSFFSEITRLRVAWISVSVCLWLFAVIAQTLLFVIQSTLWQQPQIFADIHGVLINLIAVSWVYIIGYYALHKPEIWTLSEEMNRQLEPPPEPHPPKETSREADTATDDSMGQSAEVLAKLADVMESKEPYLDEYLTLAKLARMAGIPAYLLGRTINRELGKNFMTYVNGFRVARAQLLLRDPNSSEERILDVAFRSGFRTKSAFNDSFKKLTGMTPSQYRQGKRA